MRGYTVGKGTVAASQMFRLDSDLWMRMSKEAEVSGRTPRQELEWRLNQTLGENLEKGSWVEVEQRLTPRARALTRLLGFLAGELTTNTPEDEDYDYLQRGLSRLLDRLGGKELPGPEHPAEMIEEILWLRLFNARERTYENGAPIPMTPEQRALAEIRSELAIGQTKAMEPPRKKQERE
jgi:hypothetical protein